MHAKNLVFVSGLPRSGSTLLCQLLGQHPDVYSAGHSSPLCHALEALRRQLSESYAPFAHLVFPAMPAHELVAYLASELGANVDSNSGLAGHVRALEQRLCHQRQISRKRYKLPR